MSLFPLLYNTCAVIYYVFSYDPKCFINPRFRSKFIFFLRVFCVEQIHIKDNLCVDGDYS